MGKEKINMSDIIPKDKDYFWFANESKDFKGIEETITSADSEENMRDFVFQRKSDGKYFKVSFTVYHDEGSTTTIKDEVAEEVIPTQVTVTIYK